MTPDRLLPKAFARTASSLFRVFTAAVAMTMWVSSASVAESQDEKEEPTSVPGVVRTADGWDIHYTYWQSPMGKEAPVVILLHGKGQPRLVWKALPLAEELAKAQYAVIAVDLRKHGESNAPEGAPVQARSSKISKSDYGGMISGDLEAIKKFIYTEHQAQRLNMRKLGVVATDMSTVIALNWAALDWSKKPYDDAPVASARTPKGQDVQALVLVSPVTSLVGIGTIKSTQYLRTTGISVLLLYSSKTPKEKQTSAKMYSQLGGAKQDKDDMRIFNFGFDLKLTGTNLIGRHPDIQPGIKKFLTDHVQGHDAPWKNRQSRLE